MGDPKRNGNSKLDPAPVEMPATVEEVGESDATEGKPTSDGERSFARRL